MKVSGPYIGIIAIQALSGTKVEEESCLIQNQVISIFSIPLPSLTEPRVLIFYYDDISSYLLDFFYLELPLFVLILVLSILS